MRGRGAGPSGDGARGGELGDDGRGGWDALGKPGKGRGAGPSKDLASLSVDRALANGPMNSSSASLACTKGILTDMTEGVYALGPATEPRPVEKLVGEAVPGAPVPPFGQRASCFV
jgi:hypothetical protein